MLFSHQGIRQRLLVAHYYIWPERRNRLLTLQLELYSQALLDSSGVIIADVRDEARIQQVLSFTRPDVVFHVAAHKHLPLLERRPCGAVKSNILGTRNVVRRRLSTTPHGWC